MSAPTDSDAFPIFDEDQLTRLRRYGTPAQVDVGEVLFRAGQLTYDFVVLENATAETVREASADLGEAVLARHGPRQF